MSLSCFQLFLDKLTADRQRYGTETPVEICFHGGEPTLVGRDRLQAFINAACQKLGRDKVSFSMQTNGTLLDKDWQNFMVENSLDIGISLDGRTYRENSFRFDGPKHFSRQYTYLKQHPRYNKGVLALIHRRNLKTMLPFLIYASWRYKKCSIKVNMAEFIGPTAEKNAELTGIELAKKFYIPLLRWSLWLPSVMESSVKKSLVQFVDKYVYRNSSWAKTDNPRCLCGVKFCGAGQGIINLLPDGDLWGCQRSLGLSNYKLGNIYINQPDIFGLKYYTQLLALALPMAKSIRERHCDTCFAADICNYGCRAFSLLKSGGATAIEEKTHCAAYKILRRYFSRHVQDMVVLFALLQHYTLKKNKDKVDIYFPVSNEQTSHHNKYTVFKNNLSWDLRLKLLLCGNKTGRK